MTGGQPVHIPVRVRFFSAVIPHNTQIYVVDLRVLVVYFISPECIPASALPFLEWAVNAEAEHWAPIPEPEPTPRNAVRIQLVADNEETPALAAHPAPVGGASTPSAR